VFNNPPRATHFVKWLLAPGHAHSLYRRTCIPFRMLLHPSPLSARKFPFVTSLKSHRPRMGGRWRI